MEGHEILLQKLYPLRKFLAKNSITEGDIGGLKAYLSTVTLLSSLMYRQRIDTFQRVTINSRLFGGEQKRITDIGHLKNPPQEFVKSYGRLNSPGESVLYATFEPITALSEMRPEIGDLITISTWNLKSDYDLMVSPIFKISSKDGVVHNELSLRANLLYQNQLQQYDQNTQKQLDIILDFIAECFAKDVDDSNHFDYFLSSHYANRILSELDGGTVDAILYPSVRQSLTASNIVLKAEVFEKYYELSLVEESTVTENLTMGRKGWFLKGSGYSKTFDNGKIIW